MKIRTEEEMEQRRFYWEKGDRKGNRVKYILCNKEKKQGRKAEEKHNLVKAKKSQETEQKRRNNN